MQRLRIVIFGAVQGVGFRPFVYRLATELALAGWVRNTSQGVVIEADGGDGPLRAFLTRLRTDLPPRAFIQSFENTWLDAAGYAGFDIRDSDTSGAPTALILPDIAPCPDCLAEMFDPADRRHLYPFTNCTNCGPRYTIIDALPYDRASTSMRGFTMCARCEAEYHDPANRRFHAQPNACPDCGPVLSLHDAEGRPLASAREALLHAADALRDGRIVAVKGVGGFHLMTDARNTEAVLRLRARKHREEKPLAVMFPSIESVRQWCDITTQEELLLTAPEAPIVLVATRTDIPHTARSVGKKLFVQDTAETSIAFPASLLPTPHSPLDAIAPNNPTLGAMLPSSPLHAILLRELDSPVIATSGNISDEPICIDNDEAVARLHGVADLFLVHNRPIRRHVDDSIARIIDGREMLLRRARGYAPLPVVVSGLTAQVLALGAHQKNTVALAMGGNVFVSQHIGDLSTLEAHTAFTRVRNDMLDLYGAHPEQVVCDLHPDYHSTHAADAGDLPVARIQHHAAHVAACKAENGLAGPVLGVAWDGTGLGIDDTIWGGEFLRMDDAGWSRLATLRGFPLPGGDAASREPRRAALGLLYAMSGEDAFTAPHLRDVFTPDETAMLRSMLLQERNTPQTHSAGRLFDAIASLLHLRQRCAFEGQAAMELEFLAAETEAAPYPFELRENKGAEDPIIGDGDTARPRWILDWEMMLRGILADLDTDRDRSAIAAAFHATLADMIVAVARAVALPRVLLSGGCFQNRLLSELTISRLRGAGFQPYWHQRIPPNDGCIALGQAVLGSAARVRIDLT
ncbi:MAG: carbamoyltransferase HypF [Ignavibacteriae bacterium]|nr:carbamoyltransferase HypF [Ignavibacteriota bacterium]